MRYARTGLLAILAFYFFFYTIGGAQAAPFQEIPDAVNHALFGGSNLTAARMILAGGILASIGLALSVGKMNFFGTVIVLLVVSGILTAMGWLQAWLLVLAALIVAAFWSKQAANWIGGGTGE
jgi:hypothetical protein